MEQENSLQSSLLISATFLLDLFLLFASFYFALMFFVSVKGAT